MARHLARARLPSHFTGLGAAVSSSREVSSSAAKGASWSNSSGFDRCEVLPRQGRLPVVQPAQRYPGIDLVQRGKAEAFTRVPAGCDQAATSGWASACSYSGSGAGSMPSGQVMVPASASRVTWEK
jgi:hypothetical protein